MSARRSGSSSSVPPRASTRARCSTARKRCRSVAATQARAEVGRVLDPVVERQRGEPVGRGQGVHDPGRGPAGGDHLPALHAAGAVEHQHHVARAGRRGRGRRQHGQPEGALLPLRIAGHGQGVRGPVGLPVGQPQDEVAVGPLPGLDAQVVPLPHDRVQAGADLAQRQAGRVDVDVDREPDRVGEAGQQHRRGDPRRVRNRVGVRVRARRPRPARRSAHPGCTAAPPPAAAGTSPHRPHRTVGRPG